MRKRKKRREKEKEKEKCQWKDVKAEIVEEGQVCWSRLGKSQI